MKKALKWILIIILIAVVVFVISVISLIFLYVDSTSDEGVHGDVVILHDGDIKVGDLVPVVFQVPEKYDDLHMEMWDCFIETDGELKGRFDYIIERIDFQELYTQEELEKIFINSPVIIYEDDDYQYGIENSIYSSRVALFIPEEAGVYHISVLGYYRTTSPSGYGSIKVVVYE